jgi:hypothetical protein
MTYPGPIDTTGRTAKELAGGYGGPGGTSANAGRKAMETITALALGPGAAEAFTADGDMGLVPFWYDCSPYTAVRLLALIDTEATTGEIHLKFYNTTTAEWEEVGLDPDLVALDVAAAAGAVKTLPIAMRGNVVGDVQFRLDLDGLTGELLLRALLVQFVDVGARTAAATTTLPLDADATTLPADPDDTPVTFWPDISGSGRHGTGPSTQCTYQSTGLNGFPSVRSTGVNGFFGFPRPVEDDWTIYIVMATSDAGAASDAAQWYSGAALLDGDVLTVHDDWGITMKASGHVAVGVGGPDTTVTATCAPVNDGLPHVICVTRDGTTGAVEIYVDEVLVGSGTLPTGIKDASGFIYIGASYAAAQLVADYGRIRAHALVHAVGARNTEHAMLRAQFSF